MIWKFRRFVLDEHQIKEEREMADIVGISNNSMHRILPEELEIKEYSAYVPQSLISESFEYFSWPLGTFLDCLYRFITVDETWVHH